MDFIGVALQFSLYYWHFLPFKDRKCSFICHSSSSSVVHYVHTLSDWSIAYVSRHSMGILWRCECNVMRLWFLILFFFIWQNENVHTGSQWMNWMHTRSEWKERIILSKQNVIFGNLWCQRIFFISTNNFWIPKNISRGEFFFCDGSRWRVFCLVGIRESGDIEMKTFFS